MESSIDNTHEELNYIGSLIHEGFYDKLIIIGFPYDLGATRCGVKRG
jgi:protein required for attachment to host cells